MDSVQVRFGIGFKGWCQGIAANPDVQTQLAAVFQHSGNVDKLQIYDGCTVQVVVTAGATATIDLVSGLTNPLGEAISSANKFNSVQVLMIQHDADSQASGITAFGAGSNKFQGPISATGTITLPPKRGFAFFTDATDAGWSVNASTSHLFEIVNNDGSHDATVNLYIEGLIP